MRRGPARLPSRLAAGAVLGRQGTDHPVRQEDSQLLENGGEVSITATAPGPGDATIGFAEVPGRILPAVDVS